MPNKLQKIYMYTQEVGDEKLETENQQFLMFATFQYSGLNLLGLHCILTIKAWLKSNINFNSKYLEL